MRKRMFFSIFITAFLFLLAACSNNFDSNNDASNVNMDSNDDNSEEMDSPTEEANNASGENANEDFDESEDRSTADSESGNRMVIYTADMFVTTSDFQKMQHDVQSLIGEMEGFIVDSSIYSSDDNNQHGQVTARIPQENFNDFLDQVEAFSDKVEERNVNGQDVTKEYVDLESRLNAKKDVEKRLEALMEKAKNSNDLLDISNKLGEEQEEIESIKGQIKYLENHSAMSTVTISMTEEKVNIDGVKKQKDLNTWQKTKQALVNSTNAIITFFSGLVIFLVGYSPILVPLIVIALVIYWIYRKRKNNKE